jgi:hypothetical protein
MITIFGDFCQFFGEEIGFDHINHCYGHIFVKIEVVWAKNANFSPILSQRYQFFFDKFSGENILKVITSVLGWPDWANFRFAQRATAYFGRFFKTIRSSLNFWLLFSSFSNLFSRLRLCINFDKNGLGYILGVFFTNSFGDPGCNQRSRNTYYVCKGRLGFRGIVNYIYIQYRAFTTPYIC